AEILEGEDTWMTSLADGWLNRYGTKQYDQFVIEVEPLQSAPVGLVRRVLRGALRRAGSALYDVTFEQIEGVRGLLGDRKSGKVVEISHGVETAREFDRLVFRQKLPAAADYEYKLKIPGSVHIPELGKVFRAELVRSEERETLSQRVFVDADSIGPY